MPFILNVLPPTSTPHLFCSFSMTVFAAYYVHLFTLPRTLSQYHIVSTSPPPRLTDRSLYPSRLALRTCAPGDSVPPLRGLLLLLNAFLSFVHTFFRFVSGSLLLSLSCTPILTPLPKTPNEHTSFCSTTLSLDLRPLDPDAMMMPLHVCRSA